MSLRSTPMRFAPRASEWTAGMLHLSARIAITSALPGNLRNGVATERRAMVCPTNRGTHRYVWNLRVRTVAFFVTVLGCRGQVKGPWLLITARLRQGAIRGRCETECAERRPAS